jgi:hypothetical protein
MLKKNTKASRRKNCNKLRLTIAFHAPVSGVTHIKLTDFQNHGDLYTALHEIRFGATAPAAGTDIKQSH